MLFNFIIFNKNTVAKGAGPLKRKRLDCLNSSFFCWLLWHPWIMMVHSCVEWKERDWFLGGLTKKTIEVSQVSLERWKKSNICTWMWSNHSCGKREMQRKSIRREFRNYNLVLIPANWPVINWSWPFRIRLGFFHQQPDTWNFVSKRFGVWERRVEHDETVRMERYRESLSLWLLICSKRKVSMLPLCAMLWFNNAGGKTVQRVQREGHRETLPFFDAVCF